jgi:methionine-gamma-lyase
MGGAIIGKKELLDPIRAQAQVNLGGVISPFNAWLIMRGSVTLPLRMRQHNENAMKLAEYLESLPCVSFVRYPGLKSHPGHAVAASQMSPGYGGVIAFALKADHDAHNRFVSHLRVITSAVSLGHDESLIVFLGEKDERQYLYPPEFHNGFFRFSVGIEDAEDLIVDIEQALKKAKLLSHSQNS